MARTIRFLPVFLLLSPTPVFAACHVDQFAFGGGGTTSTTSASADGGSLCTIHIRPGTKTGLDSVTIANRPQHGSANASGDSTDYLVTYKAPGGYRGADQFSIAIKGASPKGSGTATVVVNVNIH
jgi:hypothetical protein